MESEKKMVKWSLIIVFTVSIFVGRVCPVSQTGHDNSTAEVITKVTDTSPISKNNDNNTVAPIAKSVEVKNEKLNDSTSVNRKCNSTTETENMLNCNVMPKDNDDAIEGNLPPKTTEPTTTTTITIPVSNKTEANNTETQTSKITPDKNDSVSTEKLQVIPLDSTEATHRTHYDVASTEINNPINTNDTKNDSKPDANRTETSISSAAPLLADDIIGEVKSTNHGRNKSMPSGVIALVTAISFAVAIAIVYIAMIVWRRYIEYRYGHRELLVNELEFDTNDLRHFEL
ncbi:hybrid signal transduction histidine kinase A-like [Colletes gigas]|uniref:hybrid signal transduction histidine kinase A-like n=1 Tax=Colletes gigas TaxID=935657 RepID=UPI001C9ABC6C|nr:hybrid signal transduction histidine kinase A-like [Colletes gigas]XP_043248049.1 hybrid signal transduction histidine kinase A-like [Colletes gigas]XP_043248050.1 hybrid signal transduction histidine kinase A-like [Colletes gigas]